MRLTTRATQDLEKSNGAKLENKDIFAYLIMPVQRIPRYQLLLRDLLKHTEKDHNDFESLQKVNTKCRIYSYNYSITILVFYLYLFVFICC